MDHGWPNYLGLPAHSYEPARQVGKYPERKGRVKALGNAVVPQCVYPIAELLAEKELET